MDIGTAKPTLEQQHKVKHYLIDVVTPDVAFSVAGLCETSRKSYY